MELNNDFRVSVDPHQAWGVLTDLERIAPLLPGAQLQEVDGDEYRGIVKVKVGPITAQYKGTASFTERDETAGRMVLKAAGRDTRGQGNANAVIGVSLLPDGTGTKVSVVTDLTITGKVAQFGRGVIADISGKLINQFVKALEADLESQAGTEPVPAAPAAAAPPSAPAVGAVDAPAGHPAGSTGATGATTTANGTAPSHPGTAAPATKAAGGARRIDGPEAKPVDLLDAAGTPVIKRLLPLLGGIGVLLVVVARRRARRR